MRAPGAAAKTTAEVGRNDPCPCGSGRKYKHCCQAKDPRADMPAGMAQGSPSALRRRLDPLTLAAKAHYDAQRWADAIPLFREVVRFDPKNAAAHHNLGLACQAGGLSAEAVASLKRAVELQPSLESALIQLAAALLQQGRVRSLGRLSQAEPKGRRPGGAPALFGTGVGDARRAGRSGERTSPPARFRAPGGQGAGFAGRALVDSRDVRRGCRPLDLGDRGISRPRLRN